MSWTLAVPERRAVRGAPSKSAGVIRIPRTSPAALCAPVSLECQRPLGAGFGLNVPLKRSSRRWAEGSGLTRRVSAPLADVGGPADSGGQRPVAVLLALTLVQPFPSRWRHSLAARPLLTGGKRAPWRASRNSRARVVERLAEDRFSDPAGVARVSAPARGNPVTRSPPTAKTCAGRAEYPAARSARACYCSGGAASAAGAQGAGLGAAGAAGSTGAAAGSAGVPGAAPAFGSPLIGVACMYWSISLRTFASFSTTEISMRRFRS
jgi:hypothetical protein